MGLDRLGIKCKNRGNRVGILPKLIPLLRPECRYHNTTIVKKFMPYYGHSYGAVFAIAAHMQLPRKISQSLQSPYPIPFYNTLILIHITAKS